MVQLKEPKLQSESMKIEKEKKTSIDLKVEI